MIKAIQLKTEYLTNPIGIDLVTPRVAWKVKGAACQSAYQLRGSIMLSGGHALYLRFKGKGGIDLRDIAFV